MKHWFTYPLITHPYDPEFMSRDGVVRVARAAEAAGFDGIGFTDHPAPSHKWLTRRRARRPRPVRGARRRRRYDGAAAG